MVKKSPGVVSDVHELIRHDMFGDGFGTLDRLLMVAIGCLYFALRLPLILSEFPNKYRPGTQMTMYNTASDFAQFDITYLPPYPPGYSHAGGNLFGVLSAPFLWVWPDPRGARLASLFAGLITIIAFYGILRILGNDKRFALGGMFLLAVYPHHLLMTGAGNPGATGIAFGTVGIYAYLRSRNGGIEWLPVSYIAVGAATFDHFWGGVVALTILVHFTLTSDSGDRIVSIGTKYALSMVPAGILYLHYTMTSSSGRYSAYTVISHPKMLLDKQTFIDFVFQQRGAGYVRDPILASPEAMIASGLFIASALIYRLFYDRSDSFAILSLSWIFFGGLILVLFPRGAIIHDYYTWWLFPGLIVGLVLGVQTATTSQKESASELGLAAIVAIGAGWLFNSIELVASFI